MKINDIGEFGLIEILRKMVAETQSPTLSKSDLILGIGDDSAVLEVETGHELATTDTLVEGIHFKEGSISWEDLGWKSMAVNLSDIAAMGGYPSYALITLGIIEDADIEYPVELYKGILSASKKYGCRIVGGDVVRSPVTFITVSMIGMAKDGLMKRSNALPGDLIAVSGHLGCSAGGLRTLMGVHKLQNKATSDHLMQSHFRPFPRLDIVEDLLGSNINSAMDISDGLLNDLSKICFASNVGAVVNTECVPTDSYLKDAFGPDSLKLALTGGEDYEILFTGSEKNIASVMKRLGGSVFVIGKIVEEHPGKIIALDQYGVELNVDTYGWDHFSR